jgi:hypothetical protein
MVSLKLLNLLYKKLVIVFLVVVGVGGGGSKPLPGYQLLTGFS